MVRLLVVIFQGCAGTCTFRVVQGFLTAAGGREDKKICVHHEKQQIGKLASRNSNRLFVVTNPSLKRREYGGVLMPGRNVRTPLHA